MNREVHVRFCESLGVKSPRATRHVIRRGITATTSAKATKRGKFEPSPALPKAQHSRAKHGSCPCPAQCAQLKLTPGVRCGTRTLAQAARRV